MTTKCKLHQTVKEAKDCDERISFVKRKDDLFMTGITPKGNKLSYVPISEKKLVFVNIDEIDNSQYLINNEEPTQLVFYLNFRVSMPMMDLLESSGILYDLKQTNYGKQLLANPLPEFDYQKLKDLFIDLVIEFDL